MVASHSRLQVSPRMRRETSQLLLIVSDGRGIFLEGMEVSELIMHNFYINFLEVDLRKWSKIAFGFTLESSLI